MTQEDKYPEVNHAEMVTKLAKDGQQILDTITPVKMHLLHMAVGVAGEAGELLDCVKKCVAYNQPLNVKNAIEELGDLEFYIEGVRQAASKIAGFDITREMTLIANKNKLGERYKGHQYTDQAAKDRADKVNE